MRLYHIDVKSMTEQKELGKKKRALNKNRKKKIKKNNATNLSNNKKIKN